MTNLGKEYRQRIVSDMEYCGAAAVILTAVITKFAVAMGEIPVVVKGKRKKRYEVLVLDCIFSFIGDGDCRPMTCTGLLRTIPMEKRE